ncbi:MAG: tetratricopeptide repeat protein [Candidatus Marinimicrobia bacterium]|nr:tetratricopeptide repeat protein [Candidatus Neomarinimicrobiota bacterium]
MQNSTGKVKTEALLELAFMSRVNNFSSAHRYATEALGESRRTGDREQEAYALYYLGMAYYYHSEIDTAMTFSRRSCVMAESLNNHKLLGNIYLLMGSAIISITGIWKKPSTIMIRSIHHFLLAENYRGLGAAYSSLSRSSASTDPDEKSLEFIHRASSNYRKAGYREGEAWIYYLTGLLYNSVELYDESEDALQRSLDIYRQIAEENGNVTGVAICLDQLAIVNAKSGNLVQARRDNQQALELHRQGDSRFGISTSLKYRADIEYRDRNYQYALFCLDSSLSIKKTTNDLMGYASVYELYGLIFAEDGQYPARDRQP